MTEFGEASSWLIAKQKATLIGTVFPKVRSTIRSLLVNPSNASPAAIRELGAGILKPLQSLSRIVAGEGHGTGDEIDAFAKLFSNKVLAEAIALLQLYKRLKNLEAKKGGTSSKAMQQSSDIGVALSLVMGRVGLVDGLFLGAIRHMAYGLMANDSPDKLKRYFTQLRVAKKFYDLQEEVATWGCTHTQVIASLLPLLGFPADAGMTIHECLLSPLTARIDEEKNHLRVVILMIEALLRDLDIPEVPGDEEYVIDEAKTDDFYKTVDAIRAGNGEHTWIAE